ncbi:MAG: YfkF [Ignavibacteria bacterium]|nr:MAG: YfkF [Ignavibacteria bacterium]KAF0158904.1 MAG: YfkF [Ignavibacteria bacterium]
MNKNFILALVGIGIGGIGFGLITPVTVVLLEQNNAPSWITGTSAMIGYLSVVLFSGIAGRLIDKYNIRTALLYGLSIWMIGALLHVFWYVYPLLYVIKFFMGIGGTFVFVATEVVINNYSNDSNRGKNIGLYVVLLSIGIAMGTLLIWTIKFGSWVPFVIGAAIMLIVLIIQYILFEPITTDTNKTTPVKLSIKQIPLIGLAASLVYGLFEASVIVALPIYGLRNGFSSNDVSFFLASFVIGGIILGYLISAFSDNVSKFNLLLFIALKLGMFLLLPIVNANFYFLLAVFFLIGGIVPAFYTVGLNYTIEKVDKIYVAQANGHYIMMYGIGTIAGPLIGAGLIELDKENGYWIFSALLCFCFAAVFQILKRIRSL